MRVVKKSQIKVGMEVHVELCTKSKMFSRAQNPAYFYHDSSEPNTLCDPVVLGLPGAIPIPNKKAVEYAIRVGLSLGSKISSKIGWDRKNYFYPDLPKGYQITQQKNPVCLGGSLKFQCGEKNCSVGITRAHLEEDTGKLIHVTEAQETNIDFNRAGAPLLEIVSEPQIRSGSEAVAYARALRELCLFLGVTRGVMQQGHLRFEPNINLVITTGSGEEVYTPIVEVKNINSFKSIERAIEYEHKRQLKEWVDLGKELDLGNKTTRGFNDETGETVLQREKEEAHDYRYFPDPDLIPFQITDDWISCIRKNIPELPKNRRDRYLKQYQLEIKDINAILERPSLADYFENCLKCFSKKSKKSNNKQAKTVSKFILNTLSKRARSGRSRLEEVSPAPNQIASILLLKENNLISTSSFDVILNEIIDKKTNVEDIVNGLGVVQINDDEITKEWVKQSIKLNERAAKDFSVGKDQAIGRLIGSVKKLSRGKANPSRVKELLISLLRP